MFFLLNVCEMNIALRVKIHFKHVFLLNVYEKSTISSLLFRSEIKRIPKLYINSY